MKGGGVGSMLLLKVQKAYLLKDNYQDHWLVGSSHPGQILKDELPSIARTGRGSGDDQLSLRHKD